MVTTGRLRVCFLIHSSSAWRGILMIFPFLIMGKPGVFISRSAVPRDTRSSRRNSLTVMKSGIA
jgi:hypothetical protein